MVTGKIMSVNKMPEFNGQIVISVEWTDGNERFTESFPFDAKTPKAEVLTALNNRKMVLNSQAVDLTPIQKILLGKII